MKNILLPFIAVSMALIGITYSGCQESKADSTPQNSAQKIRTEIEQLEILLGELSQANTQNVTAYGQEMGVTSNSVGLEEVTRRNEILEKGRLRLEYHKLQLIQADTTNETRNQLQLKELADDLAKLNQDGEILRKGLGGEVNTKVPK